MDDKLKKILSGQTEDHLGYHQLLDTLCHLDAITPMNNLIESAKSAGFQIGLTSCFRDFKTQLNIWNKKATGRRALLDDSGLPLEFNKLSIEELLMAIMRWSAIPGASRHHWGTEFDIYDINGLPDESYQVQLTPEEVNSGGIFGDFHDWLDLQMKDDLSFGFFRPYDVDRGGVAPERWHLSYAPVSEVYKDKFTIDLFIRVIESSDIIHSEYLIQNASAIFSQFVTNTSPFLD
jgi:LAS superfamily LD-carboxypeptidase LdcB